MILLMKDRSLLMIPGPVEIDPEVVEALGSPISSHLDPEFMDAFGSALERLRQVFQCPDGQPFILAGSGTLAMDTAAANLVERGDKVLVVNTGYFGDRFADIFERYGAEVTQVRSLPGSRPSLDEVEAALKKDRYKIISVTHVDTSTGVLADIQGIAALAQQYGVLSIVDGVCSVAGEELRMAEWGIDLAFTASQKAISAPPGLALLAAGPRALDAFRKRKTPVGSYYSDWSLWIPVMEAYEARRPAYFGTPAVNLVRALNASLGQILAEGMEARWVRHAAISNAFQAGIDAMDMGQVPIRREFSAHTMTAPRFPPGLNGPEFLKKTAEAGVILAGGLHPEIKAEYFRVGHMGTTSIAEILTTIGAIETALAACIPAYQPGEAVRAALRAYKP